MPWLNMRTDRALVISRRVDPGVTLLDFSFQEALDLLSRIVIILYLHTGYVQALN